MSNDENSNQQLPPNQTMTIQHQSEGDVVEQRLAVEGIIDEIQNTLEGKMFDVKKNSWFYPQNSEGDPIKEPLIKIKKGVLNVVRVVRSFLNSNVILSDFDKEEIRKNMEGFTRYFIYHLMANAEDYCDSDTDTLSTILEIVEIAIQASLLRAKDRGESNLIGQNETIVERTMPDGKKKILPRPF